MAEDLAIQSGGELPTALVKIARERMVTRIEFRPLLVDGGISVEPDGFKIFIHCNRSESRDFQGRLARDDTARFLPARARFTLAHEIAHTFFFDLNDRPPASIVDFNNRQTLHSLEKVCHRAALHMLLPEVILHRDYRQSDLLDPLVLRALSSRAKISTPALVLRFRYLETFSHPFGIIACIQRDQGRFVVGAISRHEGCRDVFRKAKAGSTLDTLISDAQFILNGGDKSELVVGAGTSGNRYFRFQCEEPVPSGRRSVFVTGRPEID
jgi:hypothetical protein